MYIQLVQRQLSKEERVLKGILKDLDAVASKSLQEGQLNEEIDES